MEILGPAYFTTSAISCAAGGDGRQDGFRPGRCLRSSAPDSPDRARCRPVRSFCSLKPRSGLLGSAYSGAGENRFQSSGANLKWNEERASRMRFSGTGLFTSEIGDGREFQETWGRLQIRGLPPNDRWEL